MYGWEYFLFGFSIFGKFTPRPPFISQWDAELLEEMKQNLSDKIAYSNHPRCVLLALEAAFYSQTQARICTRQLAEADSPDLDIDTGGRRVPDFFPITILLAEHKMDSSTLIAGLLQGMKLDSTLSGVRRIMTRDVTTLLNGAKDVHAVLVDTARGSAPPLSRSSATCESENQISLVMTLAGDWRVIILQLMDCLDSMRRLDSLSVHAQPQILYKCQQIFVPIAHRLGIWSVKSELEDLAFRETDPLMHALIHEFVGEKKGEAEKCMHEVIRSLGVTLRDMNASITWRTKSLRSIHRKMQKRRIGLDSVQDIFAIRIVLDDDDPTACFAVLARIHAKWKLSGESLRDYITFPKENGYRSLQFGIETPCSSPIEVQIRTQSMHVLAEHGTAAHWSYHSSGEEGCSCDSWKVASDKCMNAPELFDAVTAELRKYVYFYTESGLQKIPAGSCLRDVASHLGASADVRNFYINGYPAEGEAVVQNCDFVRIHL